MSDETAVALVQNLGLDYESLIPLLAKIVTKDQTFAELLLSAREVRDRSQEFHGWSLSGFLIRLYQTQSDSYTLSL